MFSHFVQHVTESSTSSVLEARALDHAIHEMNEVKGLQHITHVLKVTGRYFLEGVEEQLGHHRDLRSSALLLQTHRDDGIKWQNSEYFGCRRDLLDILSFRVLKNKKAMEENLYELSTIVGFRILGPGFPNSQSRGGDGLIIDPL